MQAFAKDVFVELLPIGQVSVSKAFLVDLPHLVSFHICTPVIPLSSFYQKTLGRLT